MRMTIAVLLLSMSSTVVAQDEQNARQAIEELKAEMIEARNAMELEWLHGDLVRRGITEAEALRMVEEIATIAPGRPLQFDHMRRNSQSGLDTGNPKKDAEFAAKHQDFRRWAIAVKLHLRFDIPREEMLAVFANPDLDRSGSACLRGVLDCIEVIDRLYTECLDGGHGLEFCQQLWLDEIYICEDLANDCAPGG